MPSIPATAQQSSTGTLTVFDQSTARYKTYNYQDTSGAASSFAGGMAQGIASGAAMGAMMAAKRDRDRIHNGCMYRLGWVEGKIERTTSQSTPPQVQPVLGSSVTPAASPTKADSVNMAISQVPRLAYLQRVSPTAFNEVAAFDSKMKVAPNWKDRPLEERFEAATQAYEAIYGQIYLPSEPAPNDSQAIKEKQRAMADFTKVVGVAKSRGDEQTEQTAMTHIRNIEQQIWNLRQP